MPSHAVTGFARPAVPAASPSRAVGRPSDYSPDTADVICCLLIDGLSLRSICDLPGAPSKATVCRWLGTHAEFRDQYRVAREFQAEEIAHECIAIIDACAEDRGALAVARVRIKTRQWYASKLSPRVYG